MVISASVSTTGAVKRPSSALQDDCVGWESVPVSEDLILGAVQS